jgi:hypothetical protein
LKEREEIARKWKRNEWAAYLSAFSSFVGIHNARSDGLDPFISKAISIIQHSGVSSVFPAFHRFVYLFCFLRHLHRIT